MVGARDVGLALPVGWTHRIGVSIAGTGADAGPSFASVAANPMDQLFTIEGELATMSNAAS